jgi:hypothetical protein
VLANKGGSWAHITRDYPYRPAQIVAIAGKSIPAERYLSEIRWDEYGFPKRDMLLESGNGAVAAAALFAAKLLETLAGLTGSVILSDELQTPEGKPVGA